MYKEGLLKPGPNKNESQRVLRDQSFLHLSLTVNKRQNSLQISTKELYRFQAKQQREFELLSTLVLVLVPGFTQGLLSSPKHTEVFPSGYKHNRLFL